MTSQSRGAARSRPRRRTRREGDAELAPGTRDQDATARSRSEGSASRCSTGLSRAGHPRGCRARRDQPGRIPPSRGRRRAGRCSGLEAVSVTARDIDGDGIVVTDVLRERLSALAVEDDDAGRALQARKQVVLASLVIVETRGSPRGARTRGSSARVGFGSRLSLRSSQNQPRSSSKRRRGMRTTPSITVVRPRLVDPPADLGEVLPVLAGVLPPATNPHDPSEPACA